MGGRKAIPWAHFLADVATEHPIIHFPLEFIRKNGVPQFDGKVGNASGSIDDIGFNNRVRRAGIDATRTCSAVILHRAVGFQVQIQY